MNRIHTDLLTDIAFGLAILIGSVSMGMAHNWIPGATFGAGLILGYIIHVSWRMSHFDLVESNNVQAIEDDVNEIAEAVGKIEAKIDPIDQDD